MYLYKIKVNIEANHVHQVGYLLSHYPRKTHAYMYI
jgi:hypothetical protein